MWKPIETYDKLKKKPKYAVFWFKATEHERKYAVLEAAIRPDRNMGRRVCTHWILLEPPTKGDDNGK